MSWVYCNKRIKDNNLREYINILSKRGIIKARELKTRKVVK
jgi:hypothetical protein